MGTDVLKHPCGTPDDRGAGLGVVTLRFGLAGTSHQGPRKLWPSQVPQLTSIAVTKKTVIFPEFTDMIL